MTVCVCVVHCSMDATVGQKALSQVTSLVCFFSLSACFSFNKWNVWTMRCHGSFSSASRLQSFVHGAYRQHRFPSGGDAVKRFHVVVAAQALPCFFYVIACCVCGTTRGPVDIWIVLDLVYTLLTTSTQLQTFCLLFKWRFDRIWLQ